MPYNLPEYKLIANSHLTFIWWIFSLSYSSYDSIKLTLMCPCFILLADLLQSWSVLTDDYKGAGKNLNSWSNKGSKYFSEFRWPEYISMYKLPSRFLHHLLLYINIYISVYMTNKHGISPHTHTIKAVPGHLFVCPQHILLHSHLYSFNQFGPFFLAILRSAKISLVLFKVNHTHSNTTNCKTSKFSFFLLALLNMGESKTFY